MSQSQDAPWIAVTIILAGHSYECAMLISEHQRFSGEWKNRTRGDDAVGTYQILNEYGNPKGILQVRLAEVVGIFESLPHGQGVFT